MSELRSAQDLIAAYPEGEPTVDNLGMPYANFAKEAAYLVALGKEPAIRARCTACGLRPDAWTELETAHSDFVSAQALWEASRVYGVTDPNLAAKVEALTELRGDMLDQAAFYFTSPDDQQRIAQIREGDDLADCIADVRALAQMIRPRVAEILDPEFKPASLDKALELAAAVEKGKADNSATAAVGPAGQEMRRVRDRTVARVDELQREIRRYGRHAFRNDSKTLAAFSSEYARRRRRGVAEEDATPAAPTTPATQPGYGGSSGPFVK